MTEQSEPPAPISPGENGFVEFDVVGGTGATRVWSGGEWRWLTPPPVRFALPEQTLGPAGWIQPDPWCLGCGARVEPSLGVALHTRWHNPASRPEIIEESALRNRGML